ncbi:hypothetical protein T11_16343 [Trichinella zimbabwensis]|uniref:Uncharacterized protein n=1 Tax=Trichinella zimbabwensis TaxID=268475 RepID=A0A0V1DYT7_9BILA|nr:hypothetical protein T11_16343 [Trichinella zimbabwensis]
MSCSAEFHQKRPRSSGVNGLEIWRIAYDNR